MKLAKHDNELETNAEVKSKKMGIKNFAKIVDLMRNHMYQHKVRSSVQEYMSNARDAMRERGNTKDRIVVTVPNQMNPVFKVRDFGPGITPHRMETVFSEYGESTKDNSNDETGGFGIGAKSAWAYTDSFTVVSITGGRKRTYVAHTGTHKEGSVDLISNEPTDEAQGTEIQIAVKPGDMNEFRNSIWRACYFWTAEEYPEFKGVVAHEVPLRKPTIRLDNLELAQELPSYLGLDHNHYGDYLSLVIDGIPYKVDKTFIRSCEQLYSFIQPIKCQVLVHVGNGIIDIPASRESISVESVNKEVLNKMAPVLQKLLAKFVVEEFNKAKTYPDWMKAYTTLSKVVNVDNHAKRGDYYIQRESLGSKLFSNFEVFECSTGGKAIVKRSEISDIEFAYLSHIIYVDNPAEFMVTQNRRIKEYMGKSGTRRAILFVAKEQFKMEHAPITKAITPTTTGAPVAVGTLAPGSAVAPLVKVVTVTLAESEKSMQKVIKDLGAQALSSLNYTPPIREPRELRVKEKEEFTIHKYRYGRRNKLTTTLERVEGRAEKYLYVEYKQFDKYKGEFSDMQDFCRNLGYELCVITPKSIKTVTGTKLFKHYDTWKAGFKPDAKLIAQGCYNKASNVDTMHLLRKATVKIADPVLVTMMEVYEALRKIDSESEMPDYVADMISKEVKAFTKDDAELTTHLKKTYPLLARISAPVDTNIANELVHYMNSKV